MPLTTPIETTEGRPACCAFAAGRMFYGFKNTVYYSQLMEDNSIRNLDKCYQLNDPTSENISDLLATDGGSLQIDNATNITQMKKFQGGIMIYAENGVWFLSGGEGGFSATNFAVTQVTSSGVASPQSVVVVDSTHFYWSEEGVFMISADQFGNPRSQNVVEGTFQTAYNAIPVASKYKAIGAYNRIKKQVEWLYSDDTQEDSAEFKYAFNRSLIWDLRSQGWWPQQFNADLDTSGSPVDSNFLAALVNTKQATEEQDIVYLALRITYAGTQDVLLDIGTKTNTIFQDFGNNYPTAYVDTGYETLQKPSNKKIATYCTTHFLQTEENWVDDGQGGLTLDNQSSCKMRVKWDWNNSDANGRWSPEQQVYRFRRMNFPSEAGEFNSGEAVISTRNKVRGRGNALQFKFEQEPQKDMQILGWTTTYSVKGRM